MVESQENNDVEIGNSCAYISLVDDDDVNIDENNNNKNTKIVVSNSLKSCVLILFIVKTLLLISLLVKSTRYMNHSKQLSSTSNTGILDPTLPIVTKTSLTAGERTDQQQTRQERLNLILSDYETQREAKYEKMDKNSMNDNDDYVQYRKWMDATSEHSNEIVSFHEQPEPKKDPITTHDWTKFQQFEREREIQYKNIQMKLLDEQNEVVADNYSDDNVRYMIWAAQQKKDRPNDPK